MEGDQQAMEDPIVLSYHDSIIRRSDYELLQSRNSWLNDALIGFWLDYLTYELYSKYQNEFLCFSPSLAQLIKLTQDQNEIQAIIQSLDLKNRKLILIPVNDCSSYESLGGSHWSLLVYLAPEHKFEYYDSSCASNISHAKNLAKKLAPVLGLDLHNIQFSTESCHQQNDSFNCGVHLMCNAEAVCRKYLENDERQIEDIANVKRIESFRNELIKIIDT